MKRKAIVSLVKTSDRASGISTAINLLNINPVQGKAVLLKPNFNTADEFPGSTHNDTLKHLILHMKRLGASEITVGDRSGPSNTGHVIREKGVDLLCKDLGVKLLNFESLPPDGWKKINPAGSHWRNGFNIALPVLDAGCVVTTCCLKTHGYGAVFTMSLKLSVGMVQKRYMTELHSSLLSMRKMIAEINQAYTPALILLDGIEAFTDRGPMTGTRKRADVLLAGTDRIAIDAVGLAILKLLGSNKAIMGTPIFEQEQIARAVELGLGVSGPGKIEIVTADTMSRQYAEEVMKKLRE
jgi:uncharacterized protein (DUF362 family)